MKKPYKQILIIIAILIVLVKFMDLSLTYSTQKIEHSGAFSSSGTDFATPERPWTRVGILVKDAGAGSHTLNKSIEQRLTKILEDCGFEEVVVLGDQTALNGELDGIVIVLPKEVTVWPTPLYRQGKLYLDIFIQHTTQVQLGELSNFDFTVNYHGEITRNSFGLSNRRVEMQKMAEQVLQKFATTLVQAINKNSLHSYLQEPQTERDGFYWGFRAYFWKKSSFAGDNATPGADWIHPNAKDVKYVQIARGSSDVEMILYTVKATRPQLQSFFKQKVEEITGNPDITEWERFVGGYDTWGYPENSLGLDIKILTRKESEDYTKEDIELTQKVVFITRTLSH